jgi:Na+-transporting NADH:ubiquinone oxidoreductase subunit NqrC
MVDRVIGKHEFITYALALGPDGTVRGIEILEYRETYGGEIRNPNWRRQFVGKKPGSALRLDGDIRNISGATLSSRHVTDGVRRLLVTYQMLLANI